MTAGSPSARAREIRAALGESRRWFAAIGLFSAFVNLLMLTGPLFMLQVYDRVLTRSEATLVALIRIVVFLFLMMGLLDHARARVLARAGVRFQARLDGRVLGAMLSRAGRSPASRSAPARGLHDRSASPRVRARSRGSIPGAATIAAWRTTVSRSRYLRALVRSTQKPFSESRPVIHFPTRQPFRRRSMQKFFESTLRRLRLTHNLTNLVGKLRAGLLVPPFFAGPVQSSDRLLELPPTLPSVWCVGYIKNQIDLSLPTSTNRLDYLPFPISCRLRHVSNPFRCFSRRNCRNFHAKITDTATSALFHVTSPPSSCSEHLVDRFRRFDPFPGGHC